MAYFNLEKFMLSSDYGQYEIAQNIVSNLHFEDIISLYQTSNICRSFIMNNQTIVNSNFDDFSEKYLRKFLAISERGGYDNFQEVLRRVKTRGNIVDFIKIKQILSNGEYLLENYGTYCPVECLLFSVSSPLDFPEFERLFKKFYVDIEIQMETFVDLNWDATQELWNQTQNDDVYDCLIKKVRKHYED